MPTGSAFRRPLLLVLAVLAVGTGCSRRAYDPARATRAYPFERDQPATVDIQVFRHDQNIEIVNTTAFGYRDFDLWLNQRFLRRVDALPAGGTITLSLWDFRDMRGEVFRAGGFFRTERATPLRLVEIEPTDGSPMVGLVTIRDEDDV